MNSSAIISKPEAEGWTEVRVRGSRHYFKRLGSKMTVCVPHPKKDLPIGTVRSIEKQAGIRFK